MKSVYELLMSTINDAAIPERFKLDARADAEICDSCPDNSECWSCGPWYWWK